MMHLSDWPADAQALVGLFTGIDDTLTTSDAITPDALVALVALVPNLNEIDLKRLPYKRHQLSFW